MSKTIMDPNDFESLFNLDKNQSDRAIAIVSACIIETFLGQLLEKFMIKDQQICNNLLNGFGPLATFSARRECAYAFGYIDEETRNNIKCIGKIRNEFAHNNEVNSFNEAPITDLFKNLSTVTMHKEPLQQYFRAVGMTIGYLHSIIISKNTKT